MISNQTKIKLNIQAMLDRGDKWSEISRKTKISRLRLEEIMAGRAVPTPREEHDLFLMGDA